jgi:hypothetical protein
MMGGGITVASEPGKGSVFTVRPARGRDAIVKSGTGTRSALMRGSSKNESFSRTTSAYLVARAESL